MKTKEWWIMLAVIIVVAVLTYLITINVSNKPVLGSPSNQTCTVGWKCYDSNTKAVQYADCNWAYFTKCSVGQECINGDCKTYTGNGFNFEVMGNSYVDLRNLDLKTGVISLPIIFGDPTKNQFVGLGKSATERLATGYKTLIYNATSSSVSQYSGFIASWADAKYAESYYLRATVTYDADGVRNLTTITDRGTGNVICEDVDPAINPTCTIGNVVLTVNKVHYKAGGDRLVDMTINSGGYFNRIYNSQKNYMVLPTNVLNISGSTYAFNVLNFSGSVIKTVNLYWKSSIQLR